jgi:hypothetical protein
MSGSCTYNVYCCPLCGMLQAHVTAHVSVIFLFLASCMDTSLAPWLVGVPSPTERKIPESHTCIIAIGPRPHVCNGSSCPPVPSRGVERYIGKSGFLAF